MTDCFGNRNYLLLIFTIANHSLAVIRRASIGLPALSTVLDLSLEELREMNPGLCASNVRRFLSMLHGCLKRSVKERLILRIPAETTVLRQSCISMKCCVSVH